MQNYAKLCKILIFPNAKMTKTGILYNLNFDVYFSKPFLKGKVL